MFTFGRRKNIHTYKYNFPIIGRIMTPFFLRSVHSLETKDRSSDPPGYQLSIRAKLNTEKSELTPPQNLNQNF